MIQMRIIKGNLVIVGRRSYLAASNLPGDAQVVGLMSRPVTVIFLSVFP